MMCSATSNPEAILLRSITTKVILRALTKFFSTFGLPKIVQMDQGSNFRSKMFNHVMSTLSISHIVSSAYHPESQGALERWHQTLKSMLKKYCLGTEKEWDEGVPLVLFAVRETVKESLGFSPADLVFGLTVHGSLKVLKDHILSPTPVSRSVPDHVTQLRERLSEACEMARCPNKHEKNVTTRRQ